MSEEIKNNPVIRVSIAGTVGDKCQISFETYVDAAADTKFINALTDKLMFVRDRQVAKYEIVDMKKLLTLETNQLDAMMGDLERVDARNAKAVNKGILEGKRIRPTLTPREETDRQNIVTNIEVRKNRLEVLAKDIADREAKVTEVG